MGCFPLALVFGIAGIVRDQSKLLAIIMSVIASALVLLYVRAMAGA